MAPPPRPRTEVRRRPDRASYDRATIDAILDEGLVAHVGFVADGAPVVIPTTYARAGDVVYLHGSPASRMLRHLGRGVEVSVAVTLLDGVVLSRSWMHHSLNYRSVVLFGRAQRVDGDDEKRGALRAVVEHVVPGRSDATREPSRRELDATLLLALPISEVSAKVRIGPPVDDEEDYGLPVWAGELPVRLVAGPPRPDPRLAPAVVLPDHVRSWVRPLPSPAGDGSLGG